MWRKAGATHHTAAQHSAEAQSTTTHSRTRTTLLHLSIAALRAEASRSSPITASTHDCHACVQRVHPCERVRACEASTAFHGFCSPNFSYCGQPQACQAAAARLAATRGPLYQVICRGARKADRPHLKGPAAAAGLHKLTPRALLLVVARRLGGAAGGCLLGSCWGGCWRGRCLWLARHGWLLLGLPSSCCRW